MSSKTVTLSNGQWIRIYLDPRLIQVDFPDPNTPGGRDVRGILHEHLMDVEVLSGIFEDATVRVFRAIVEELSWIALAQRQHA